MAKLTFRSVRALADYLQYLDRDPLTYQLMLSWRNEYELYQRWPLCSLCEKLHLSNEPNQIYSDVYQWWYKDNQGEFLCHDGHSRHYFYSKDDFEAKKLAQIDL